MKDARKYERAKFAAGIAGLVLDVFVFVYFLASGWTFRIRVKPAATYRAPFSLLGPLK